MYPPNPAQPLPQGGAGNGARAFNYLFYVDFAGSLAEPQAQNALRHLQVGRDSGALEPRGLRRVDKGRALNGFGGLAQGWGLGLTRQGACMA